MEKSVRLRMICFQVVRFSVAQGIPHVLEATPMEGNTMASCKLVSRNARNAVKAHALHYSTTPRKRNRHF